jgi:aspartate/methionine/tyrosine aminotransferase
VALELNSLSKTFLWAGVGMVLGNANAIDAVLKVNNMDSGMFYGMKGPLKLKSEKAWFDSMNEIYKTTNPYRQLAEKLGCKVYKEGVGLLFGQN